MRFWGEECVLYSIASGDTHLIGPLAAQILSHLQQGAADSAMLAEYFADSAAEDVVAKLGAKIESILDDFEKYRLIKWNEP